MGERLGEAITGAIDWFEDRSGLISKIKPIMEHPVPKGSKWAYVFGSATLFSFVLQVVTGVILATMYVPSTNGAFQSLQHIQDVALFGHIVRGMHYFGASAMFLFIGIHMLRVFLYAAYKYPREVNWLSGVLLLILTLMMGFTGQLMRWDQNAIWSVNIAAKQAARLPFIGGWMSHLVYGGDHLSGITLTRFFDFHVFLIPGAMIAIIGLHLYLVLYNGISEPPKAGAPVDPHTYKKQYQQLLKKEGVPFWPDAAWRDALFGSLVIAACVALARPLARPNSFPRPIPACCRPILVRTGISCGTSRCSRSARTISSPTSCSWGRCSSSDRCWRCPSSSTAANAARARRPWAVAWVVIVCLSVLGLWREGKIAPWSPRFQSPPLPDSLPPNASSAAFHGQVLFHDKGCEYCHEVNGLGGIRGPDLSNVGNRLTEQDMVIRILNGGRNMPAFGGILHPDEVSDSSPGKRESSSQPPAN